MSNKSSELENVLREHVTDLIKNMVLEVKIEEYYHPHKGEDIKITSYWDSNKLIWVTKDNAIRSNINKKIKPIIDTIIEENKDFIKFFL